MFGSVQQEGEQMAPQPWRTRASRDIYRNTWVRLREDIAELPDGRTTIYSVLTPGIGQCVGVLPFLPDGRVVMIRQYRYVYGEGHRWEMPTGGMHEGETPEEAAQRELQEETGYRAGRFEWICSYYTSKSVVEETAHLFLGFDLTPSSLPPDETEFLEIEAMPFEQVLDMVLRSDIRDSMTVTAVLHAARRLGV
jgi:NTP pyrophosphohydrolases including oxidative damage repair enzymes